MLNVYRNTESGQSGRFLSRSQIQPCKNQKSASQITQFRAKNLFFEEEVLVPRFSSLFSVESMHLRMHSSSLMVSAIRMTLIPCKPLA
jgi:hypothetical protein